MQAAFAKVDTGVRLSLSGLTVVINDLVSITNKSNFVIDGEGGTIIAKNGMSVSSGKMLILLTNCESFKIENITFDANRANRTPAEVAAQTVYVVSCRKFVFENVHSNNAVVDGFYFATATNTNPATYCLDFQIINCFADNGYRQGVSTALRIMATGRAYLSSTHMTSSSSAVHTRTRMELCQQPELMSSQIPGRRSETPVDFFRALDLRATMALALCCQTNRAHSRSWLMPVISQQTAMADCSTMPMPQASEIAFSKTIPSLRAEPPPASFRLRMLRQ
jgi:hypothetical protein